MLCNSKLYSVEYKYTVRLSYTHFLINTHSTHSSCTTATLHTHAHTHTHTHTHTHSHTHSREHDFSLHARVVRSESLVLLHFLLHTQYLGLELATECREGVTNVVGQRLRVCEHTCTSTVSTVCMA